MNSESFQLSSDLKEKNLLESLCSELTDHKSKVLDLRGNYLKRIQKIKLVDEKEKESVLSQISFISLLNSLPESPNIEILNLNYNKLTCKSLNKESMEQIMRIFPNIKVLKLTFNILKDRDILEFESFIRAERTCYLDLTGTDAGTIFGMQKLYQKLVNSTTEDDLKRLLSKVIWIPEEVIDRESTKWNAPQFEIDSHKEYFKQH